MNDKLIKTILLLVVLLILSVRITDYLYKTNIKRIEDEKNDYYNNEYINDNAFKDAKYFPIALPNSMKDEIYYDNSYGSERTYGGNRTHEGIDIFTKDNIPGQFPIVSVCDGIIEKIGWLELGGYRVGIRSETGIYYYYAHLHRYDEEIKEGMKVWAGQIIGYIGDTGYSKVEGTSGNFPVHLHFGIYMNDGEKEITLNPYPMLNKLRNSILLYDF